MIPKAARRGDYVFTSTINGAGRGGKLAPTLDAQLNRAFEKLPEALANAGAGLGDVVQVGVYLADASAEAPVDTAWRAVFGTRAPARRVTQMFMPSGELAQIQATAYTGSGRLFVTPAVGGRRPNGELPAGVHDEIAQALDNVCDLVVAAGGTPDDLVHFWAFAKEGIVAVDFTDSWVKRFPHEGDRPARKTFLRAPLHGAERALFQATAVIGGGKRTNYEVRGVRHRDPLPMGARVGNLFMSSGILGNAPDPNDPSGLGPMGETLDDQLGYAFRCLETLMSAQGGSLANVGLLSGLVNGYQHVPGLLREMEARFSPVAMPALQLWSMPMASAQQMVQLFATAVF